MTGLSLTQNRREKKKIIAHFSHNSPRVPRHVVGNSPFFGMILVVYLGHGSFSSGMITVYLALNQFWGEVLRSQNDENLRKK